MSDPGIMPNPPIQYGSSNYGGSSEEDNPYTGMSSAAYGQPGNSSGNVNGAAGGGDISGTTGGLVNTTGVINGTTSANSGGLLGNGGLLGSGIGVSQYPTYQANPYDFQNANLPQQLQNIDSGISQSQNAPQYQMGASQASYGPAQQALENEITGARPSVAALQLGQTTAQNINNQMSMAASNPGAGGAANYNAMRNAGQIQQQSVGQAATLAAQQQAAAIAQYSQNAQYQATNQQNAASANMASAINQNQFQQNTTNGLFNQQANLQNQNWEAQMGYDEFTAASLAAQQANASGLAVQQTGQMASQLGSISSGLGSAGSSMVNSFGGQGATPNSPVSGGAPTAMPSDMTGTDLTNTEDNQAMGIGGAIWNTMEYA